MNVESLTMDKADQQNQAGAAEPKMDSHFITMTRASPGRSDVYLWPSRTQFLLHPQQRCTGYKAG